MTRPRFTIASLLGAVLLAGLAFAALREATALWDGIVFTLVAGLLLASVLLAVHRDGEARAYWLGFALFGAAYVVASAIPPVESRLGTSRTLAYLGSKVPGRSPRGLTGNLTGSHLAPTRLSFAPDGTKLAVSNDGTVRLWDASTGTLLAGPSGTIEDFVRIGHSLVALLVALAGGRLSRWMHGGRPGDASPADIRGN